MRMRVEVYTNCIIAECIWTDFKTQTHLKATFHGWSVCFTPKLLSPQATVQLEMTFLETMIILNSHKSNSVCTFRSILHCITDMHPDKYTVTSTLNGFNLLTRVIKGGKENIALSWSHFPFRMPVMTSCNGVSFTATWKLSRKNYQKKISGRTIIKSLLCLNITLFLRSLKGQRC